MKDPRNSAFEKVKDTAAPKVRKLIKLLISPNILIKYGDICYVFCYEDLRMNNTYGLVLEDDSSIYHKYTPEQLDSAEIHRNEIKLYDGETYKTYSLYTLKEIDAEKLLECDVETVTAKLIDLNENN